MNGGIIQQGANPIQLPKGLLGYGGTVPAVYPVPRPFSPYDVSGLSFWFDASDASSLFSTAGRTQPTDLGQPVAYISSKTPFVSSAATQSTLSSRGTLSSVPTNGLTSVSLNGTSSSFTSSLSTPSMSVTNVVVCVPTSLSGVKPILGGGNGEAGRNNSMQIRAGAWAIGLSGVVSSGITARQETTVICTTIDSPNQTATIVVNGVSSGPLAAAFNTGIESSLYVGTSGFGEFFAGRFCEFMRYSRILSANEMLYIQRAMAAKWGAVLR